MGSMRYSQSHDAFTMGSDLLDRQDSICPDLQRHMLVDGSPLMLSLVRLSTERDADQRWNSIPRFLIVVDTARLRRGNGGQCRWGLLQSLAGTTR